MALIEALDRHARERPDEVALVYLEDGESVSQRVTFAELQARSASLAAEIRTRYPIAERAMIVMESGPDFVISMLACFSLGIVAVPSAPPSQRRSRVVQDRFTNLIEDACPDLILVHAAVRARLFRHAEQSGGIGTQNWLYVDEDFTGHQLTTVPSPGRSEAFIQYTSGSTGQPKGVVVTHDNLSANLAAIECKFGLSTETVVVNWLPPFHDMGLIGGVLQSIWTGYQLVLLPTRRFAEKPLRWLQAIDRFNADVSGGADFAYDLCVRAAERDGSGTLDLSRWRLAFSGAEPVRARTLARFSSTFAASGFRQQAFFPTWGLAEATLMVTGPAHDGQRPTVLQLDVASLAQGRAEVVADETFQVVSCGTPCEPTEVFVVDPETRQLMSDNQVGELCVLSESVSPGYWRRFGDPLRLTTTIHEKELLATGDLGFRSGGEFYVTGRIKDLIIMRGRNLYPGDIEEFALLADDALSPGGALAFGVETGTDELLVLICEVKRAQRRNLDKHAVVSAVLNSVSKNLGVVPHDILLVPPASLPRTTSGKLQRDRARTIWLEGGFKVIGSLSSDVTAVPDAIPNHFASSIDRRQNLLPWFCERLTLLSPTNTVVTPESHLMDAGFDSLMLIELVFEIESSLGISVSIDLLLAADSVSELVGLLENHTTAVESLSQPVSGEIPITPMQSLILKHLDNHESFFEVLVQRTPQELDVTALKLALDHLFGIHDAFLMRFVRGKEQCTLQPVAGHQFVLHEKTMNKGARSSSDDVLDFLRQQIDIETGPLASGVLVANNESGSNNLVLMFHHLVVDAISLARFVAELERLYEAARQNTLRTTDVYYRYSHWLAQLGEYAVSETLEDQLDYWRGVCGRSSQSSVVHMPQQVGMASKGTNLSPGLNKRLLKKYHNAYEQNCLMVAAVTEAWCKLTGASDLALMLENHGRHMFDGTSPLSTIGWLVCHYPVNVQARLGSVSPQEYLDETRKLLDAVPDQGIGYGLLRRQGLLDSAPVPKLFLQFRGAIDDVYRGDAAFPVVGVRHEVEVLWRSLRSTGGYETMINVTVRQGTLTWSVSGETVDAGLLSQTIARCLESYIS